MFTLKMLIKFNALCLECLINHVQMNQEHNILLLLPAVKVL